MQGYIHESVNTIHQFIAAMQTFLVIVSLEIDAKRPVFTRSCYQHLHQLVS